MPVLPALGGGFGKGNDNIGKLQAGWLAGVITLLANIIPGKALLHYQWLDAAHPGAVQPIDLQPEVSRRPLFLFAEGWQFAQFPRIFLVAGVLRRDLDRCGTRFFRRPVHWRDNGFCDQGVVKFVLADMDQLDRND